MTVCSRGKLEAALFCSAVCVECVCVCVFSLQSKEWNWHEFIF